MKSCAESGSISRRSRPTVSRWMRWSRRRSHHSVDVRGRDSGAEAAAQHLALRLELRQRRCRRRSASGEQPRQLGRGGGPEHLHPPADHLHARRLALDGPIVRPAAAASVASPRPGRAPGSAPRRAPASAGTREAARTRDRRSHATRAAASKSGAVEPPRHLRLAQQHASCSSASCSSSASRIGGRGVGRPPARSPPRPARRTPPRPRRAACGAPAPRAPGAPRAARRRGTCTAAEFSIACANDDRLGQVDAPRVRIAPASHAARAPLAARPRRCASRRQSFSVSLHQRVVRQLDVPAAVVVLAADLRGEHRREQVLRPRALDRAAAPACRSGMREQRQRARRVPAEARAEHRRLQHRLGQHLLHRRPGAGSRRCPPAGSCAARRARAGCRRRSPPPAARSRRCGRSACAAPGPRRG